MRQPIDRRVLVLFQRVVEHEPTLDLERRGDRLQPDRVVRVVGVDQAVNALLKDGKAVVLDVRRPDKYEAFGIAGAVSVPGAEVVLQIAGLVPDETTQVIVHCAGRTRGLIWAQALRNAGIRHPGATLKNGTIGWTMAGLPLEPHQKSRNQMNAGRRRGGFDSFRLVV